MKPSQAVVSGLIFCLIYFLSVPLAGAANQFGFFLGNLGYLLSKRSLKVCVQAVPSLL